MQNLRMLGGSATLLQMLVSLFLAILFLQSGIDKIVDRQGNLDWLKGHFAKSPLAGMVPFMFGLLKLIAFLLFFERGVGGPDLPHLSTIKSFPSGAPL